MQLAGFIKLSKVPFELTPTISQATPKVANSRRFIDVRYSGQQKEGPHKMGSLFLFSKIPNPRHVPFHSFMESAESCVKGGRRKAGKLRLEAEIEQSAGWKK